MAALVKRACDAYGRFHYNKWVMIIRYNEKYGAT